MKEDEQFKLTYDRHVHQVHGLKFDSDKPQYSLIPPNILEEVAHVLTFGAKKYAPDNWKQVDNAIKRYTDAHMRHTEAMRKGELNDPESGYSHASHAICCLMFIAELQRAKP